MFRNTATSYGWPSIALHWLMAIAIIAMFALGVWMTSLTYYDRWYHDAPELHKSIGMLLMLMLIVRFGWRLINTPPALAGQWWEQLVALAVHRLHYVLMFIVMCSGYLIPTAEGTGIDLFGWFTIPATLTFDRQQADLIGTIHRLGAWAIIGLTVLHAGAALKHHFIDRDNTLLRMFGR
ncbi:cytochrome b [Mariprofundus erugo]|uniref:cytochrome b n=1 Tax=Mariprofundus erugo TaxID=2528639 RepID=UPI00159C9428|nr:cytochrome b [Mariprofundus erugo]